MRGGDRDRVRLRRAREVAAPPAAELVDRRAWAGNALATLAEAASPIEERIAGELELPGPLGAIARRGVAPRSGRRRPRGRIRGEAGARQYDIALIGPVRPARLLFVAENMEGARHNLEADRAVFLRWVALHETTHVIQFERVDWLAAHMRVLAAGLIEGAADGLDPAGLAALGGRLLRDPRDLVRRCSPASCHGCSPTPSAAGCSTGCRRRCR